MKKILLSVLFTALICGAGVAQNSKADKEAAAAATFAKASAAIEAKDFVIVPDQYESSTGTVESSNDDFAFIAYEGEFLYLQGMIVCSNSYTNRTTVTEFKKELDKKGNLKVVIQTKGSAITAKIEISMKKNGNYADVIVTPTKGETRRFSGEVTLRSESKYRKRSNEV